MMKNKKEQFIILASMFIVAQYVLTFFVFNLTNRIYWQVLGWIL